MMTERETLLAEYIRSGSETAFRELVERYVGLVYATALRVVDGDRHLAEDVAQMVFADLARNARSFSAKVMLGGWLHQRTCHVAAPMMRARRRRQAREREAAQMSALQGEPDTSLAQIEPMLDEAITQLDADDRAAILLRFFERRDFRSMGAAMGASEDAARMRVKRALDRLEGLLRQRGATVSGAALASGLASANLSAAPMGLAANIAGLALAQAGPASAAVIPSLIMSKLHVAILGVAVLAGVATSWLWQHQVQVGLRAENDSLRQEIARQQSELERRSPPQPIAGAASASLSAERMRELLRLRNEVSRLRRQQREGQPAPARSQTPSTAGTPGTPPPAPAPFQVQLVLDQPGSETESETMTNNTQVLYVQKAPLLDYTALRAANVRTNGAAPEIEIEFTDEGSELFALVTKEHVNQRLAMVLDGKLCTAPVIRTEITGGRGVVTGSFTLEEAQALAAKINEAIGGH